ncbi:hypothetical protein BCR33DRAFT_10238 [Rhizoclosmatium globosum]|uniref:C2H2-type domain-containing protein n=1 Tax=Rhizoclosmatium globosum TaxID=329046 RepID=A0A1Y2D3I9_9FUNG|nr:hypothetical protein BCR33DRAFT_10238 [Rhizoclosmatium globosum]|eukprot:ORY53851.1 hypothetical protein BCR33DRAFT_10238 [Rhizoclosmatium globosum]
MPYPRTSGLSSPLEAPLPSVWQLFRSCAAKNVTLPSLQHQLILHGQQMQELEHSVSSFSAYPASVSPLQQHFSPPSMATTTPSGPPPMTPPLYHYHGFPSPPSSDVPNLLPLFSPSPQFEMDSRMVHVSQVVDPNPSPTVQPLAARNYAHNKTISQIQKKRRTRCNKPPTPEEMYCSLCDIKFGRKYDLTRHNASVHPTENDEETHECRVCNKWFSRADALKRHMRLNCIASIK